MNGRLRNFFIILLVQIQFFAPLVHAHSGLSQIGAGIHLPGLEFINHDHGSGNFAASSLRPGQEGVLVNISSGIKHKCAIQDVLPDVFILPEDMPLSTASNHKDGNFSPHGHPAGLQAQPIAHSPRAPPAL